MRSLSPVHLKHLAHSRLFGRAALDDICSEKVTLLEAEPFTAEPSIFLPRQLDNIVKLHPESSQLEEYDRLYGQSGLHGAVTRYRIDDVSFRDGGFYKENWSAYFPQVKPDDDAQSVEGGVRALASTYSGIQYFGHFLRDDSSTYLLAEEIAEPICARTPDWPHKPQYLDIFNFDWPVIDWGRVDKLYVFRDYAQNSSKCARYRELRRRTRQKINPKHGAHRVYLKRGAGGANKRIISNEAEMISALEREGFLIADGEQDCLPALVENLLDARIFLTIEGSQQDHGLISAGDGAGVISIVPPRIFNNAAKDWAAALGMKYGLVIGEDEGTAFRVNIADLMKVIEMTEAAL